MPPVSQDLGRTDSMTRSDPIKIVFAADRDFFPVLGVALASLAHCSSHDRRSEIMAVSEDHDYSERDRLVTCLGGRTNISLEIIPPKINLSNVRMDGEFHYSVPAAYFRLGIPELFANSRRIIYLDSDIVVEKDISLLFDIELAEHEEIAAVPALGVIQAARKGRVVEHAGRKIALTDYLRAWVAKDQLESYFNSGVILFDIEKIRSRRPDLNQEIAKLLLNDYQMPDQDILNILFSNRTRLLPIYWNVQNPSLNYDNLPSALLTEVNEALADPHILHFVTDRKPWNTLGVRRADRFWLHAASTPYAQELWNAFIHKAPPMVSRPAAHVSKGSVSVVVPLYNAAATICEALNSALAQTELCEIIVIDDGSDDGSLTIAREIEANDPRVRIIALDENRGAGNARNVGLSAAVGEFVAFLDPDDTYENDTTLEMLVSILEAEQVDAALGMQMSLRPNGVVEAKRNVENPAISGRVAFRDTSFLWPCLHHHRFVFRRAFLVSHGLRYSDHLRGQDIVFLARVMAKNPRLFAISEPVYRHRVRNAPMPLGFQQTADRFAAFTEAVIVLASEGLQRQAWHLLRSRFEGCLIDMQVYATHPEFKEIVKPWSRLREIRDAYFAAGGFDDSDFEAHVPGSMVAAILGLTSDELAVAMSKKSDRPFFTPAPVAANRTKAAWDTMARASRLAMAKVEELNAQRAADAADYEQKVKELIAQRAAEAATREQAKRSRKQNNKRNKNRISLQPTPPQGVKPIRGIRLLTSLFILMRSDLFDTKWYRRRYPDVAASGIHPVRHFLKYGCAEGRNPGPNFDVAAYYRRRPDVARAGMNALLHYLKYGRSGK